MILEFNFVGSAKEFDAFEFDAADVELLPTVKSNIDRRGSGGFLSLIITLILYSRPFLCGKLAGLEDQRGRLRRAGRETKKKAQKRF
jgi:hypothetical protein